MQKQGRQLLLSGTVYPENMTAHLQVLDLIVNGPIKRHIRACRSHELVDNFQILKAEYEAAPIRPLKIDWVVPRITAKMCIQNLRSLFMNEFLHAKFKSSIGTLHFHGKLCECTGRFEIYNESSSLGELPVSTKREHFDAIAYILDQEEDDDEIQDIVDYLELTDASDDDGDEESSDDDSGDSDDDIVEEVSVMRARSSRNRSILFAA